jgi:hypothetical protein
VSLFWTCLLCFIFSMAFYGVMRVCSPNFIYPISFCLSL